MSKNPLVKYNPPPTSITTTNRFSNAERRSGITARYHGQVIEQERWKTEKAHAALASVSQSRFRTFTETAEQMWSIKEQQRQAELQKMVDHVYDQTTQRLDSYLELSTDIGGSQIVNVLQQPTHTPHEWKPTKWYRRGIKDE